MNKTTLREATEGDFCTIVELNKSEVEKTSPMDTARLRELSAIACYHKVAIVNDSVAAFLLAMREGAPYKNDNYEWFAGRFSRFIYVDRIVVGAEFAGLKIGSALYEDLFSYARTSSTKVVTCEYNIEPLNQASQQFHNKLGFQELGRQWVANDTKLVSLQRLLVT